MLITRLIPVTTPKSVMNHNCVLRVCGHGRELFVMQFGTCIFTCSGITHICDMTMFDSTSPLYIGLIPPTVINCSVVLVTSPETMTGNS